MDFSKLAETSRQQVHMAGPRYTPTLEPDSPNLEIKPVLAAFHAMTFSEGFRLDLKAVAKDIANGWSTASPQIRRLFRQDPPTPLALSTLFGTLSDVKPGETKNLLRSVSRLLAGARRRLDSYIDSIDAERSALVHDDDRRRLDSRLSDARRFLRSLDSAAAFSRSVRRSLMESNSLLLLGEWGTGKTHLLCDLARRELEGGRPVLLFLGQNLPPSLDPIEALLRATHIAPTRVELFRSLDAAGSVLGRRVLLMFDGINEGDRSEWRRAAGRLARELSAYRHIGLVLSCRSPFDRLIFGPRARARYVTVFHSGFEGIEFDAQLEFFSYSNVSAPEFPLLSEEFARPLFLKMLCRALARMSAGRQKHHLRDLASGQKGMTYVMEHFVLELSEPVEKEFGLPPRSIWGLMKNAGGLAAAMADGRTDSLARSQAVQIAARITHLPAGRAARLVKRLITDGLLAEDVRWNSAPSGATEIIRFPYQRFSDHLIARHLLDKHLRGRSEAGLRHSFFRHRPLGRVFEIDTNQRSIAEPGLGAALMVEFPERVKRVQALHSRELIHYLPARVRQVFPLMEVFLSGLHWRSAGTFSEATDRILTVFAHQPNREVRDYLYKTLLVLAARPRHRYSASHLRRHLAALGMAERDVIWSEHIRRNREEADRLVEWTDRNALATLDDGSSRNLITLLALLLTSTDRGLRDRVTRALFRVGLRTPSALFAEAIASLSFNDPYVRERLLAAAYGVAMNLWADPEGTALRAALPAFAGNLRKLMFRKRSRYATTHALTVGYAVGVIELAMIVEPTSIPRAARRLCTSPFRNLPSPFRPPDLVSESDVETTQAALHMDFANYTLGRLIRDRGNYDFAKPSYQLVRRQILGRLADLGYSKARFGEIDQNIARFQPFGRDDIPKVDRYGKKYSWIAFFEMYGLRGALSDTADAEYVHGRPSDCDIDPSFPKALPPWLPESPALFEEDFTDPAKWLADGPTPSYAHLYEPSEVDNQRGPWLLLRGYQSHVAGRDPREVFSLLTGIIVPRRQVARLRQLVETEPYLGNHRIPEPLSDYYTYAGEVPWSWRFGDALRFGKVSARRDVRKAFERWTESGSTTGINVEIPVRRFAWEGYHSLLNQNGSVDVVAPSLCRSLGLVNHAGTTDLFDRTGGLATVYRSGIGEGDWRHSELLFVRRDLLDEYLAGSNRTLVWITWGERRLELSNIRPAPESVQSVWARYGHVHRAFRVYEAAL